ncbi:FAD-dependent monooxygenase [Agreia pratensis]|uniref:FAD-dependent oxidoreductase n=1 Tax=Agreia pratensis TaxID=150121 RepID=UPI00188D3893|nr:NAD(P)/FAD-dependent oxidoreductase [Agreia pratensis]MBF4635583.1 FAD-dependent monooxygenase [Agreia pratensis]
MRTLIVGGGIAGLAAAVSLHQAGQKTRVLEGYDRTADDVGAWLQIASNGMMALEAVGLGEATGEIGSPTTRLTTFAPDGRVTADTPLGQRPGEGPAGRSVRRSDLYRVLREEVERLGIEVIRGARVVSTEQIGTLVRVHTRSAEIYSADLVIGADGIDSAVRASLIGEKTHAKRTTPDLVGVGGVAEAGSLPPNFETPAGSLHFRFGRDCFVGSVGMDDGRTWWFVNPRLTALPGGAASVPGMSSAAWPEALAALAARDALPIRHLVEGTPALDVWAAAGRSNAVLWGRDSVALIGDAAHAIPPTSGQGASLALEDAVILGDIVREGGSPRDIVPELARRRTKRVTKIGAQGVALDRAKLLGPIGSLVRDRIIFPLTDRRSSSTGTTPMPWMYDFAIDSTRHRGSHH